MSQRISNERVKRATDRTWEQWFRILDRIGARNMTHREVARVLYEKGYLKNKMWCQGVTLEYECTIGKRVVGQNCYGEYVANAARTLGKNLNLDDALHLWQRNVCGLKEFKEVKLAKEPTTSSSEEWRYWRGTLADGSKINVTIGLNGLGKAFLNLQHGKLAKIEARETWKLFWKQF
jgi:hypothetical protein